MLLQHGQLNRAVGGGYSGVRIVQAGQLGGVLLLVRFVEFFSAPLISGTKKISHSS